MYGIIYISNYNRWYRRRYRRVFAWELQTACPERRDSWGAAGPVNFVSKL